VLPARPYKPRDKAVVENAVQVAQRCILAALRHRKFFSLAEANQSVSELLHRLNHRPFRKRDGSRASVFEALDNACVEDVDYREARGLDKSVIRALAPGVGLGAQS
jgi:hypothetical protein